jgi:hypothetical protein
MLRASLKTTTYEPFCPFPTPQQKEHKQENA